MLSAVKNVVILTASLGSGHDQAARAIEGEIKSRYPSVNIVVVDFMEQFFLNSVIKGFYLRLLAISPKMYEWLYSWSQATSWNMKLSGVIPKALRSSMLEIVEKHKPDLIINTHPFSCGAAANLKAKGEINVPVAAVITDFAVHSLWIYQEVDLYFVAGVEMRLELMNKGISGSRIHVTGIPIARDFLYKRNASGAFKSLLGNNECFTVLIMGGCLGMGGIAKALLKLDALPVSMRFIVVAGKNQRLKEALKKLIPQLRHRMIVVGYTKRIPELMSLADILITKAGALTICEALAMELPILLFEPLPGHELENAQYITTKGAALWAKNSDELQQHLATILGHQAVMKKRARTLRHPEAAGHIVDIIDGYFKETCRKDAACDERCAGDAFFPEAML
jgi:processive 1,2-diacylglycerol beta-glucosyltransferase